MSDPDGPIEEYLDRLVVELTPLGPRILRQVLAEAQEHLRDAAAEAVARGADRRAAAVEAVHRFGPARDLVAAEGRRALTPLRTVAAQVVATGWLLGGIGAVAVGVSGLIAAGVELVAGIPALVDVQPGQQLAAADCARWLAADPAVADCRAAALSDWAFEVVGYRLALGAAGVLALAGAALLRRVRPRAARGWLPAQVSDTVGFVAFALAAAWTLGLGIDAVVLSAGRGSGQWFSVVPVAAVAAAVFGLRLLRDVRTGTDTPRWSR